ncbi:MAG: DUF1643 domain-containing protein [Candidatus Aenigmarchaeota archaeon]|nr:DUF1643 domain-containing protein [Candidatus Aenigmarchaeota archaeon]
MNKFTHNDKNGSKWSVGYKSDGVYRDYVILEQILPKIPIKKKVPLIMLNPGSFNDEKGFKRDTTLRNIRKAFLNTGYVIEILNLFNKANPNREKFSKLSLYEMEKNNILYDRLNTYPPSTKIIIQWGKPQSFCKEKMEEFLEYVRKKSFVPIGIKNKDGTYRHPSIWYKDHKNFELFQQEVINQL